MLHNMSAKNALFKHHEKQLRKITKKPNRKNAKPEKAVQNAVVDYCAGRNIHLFIVDSSAVYSHGAGRYLRGKADPGFPDATGFNNDGRALYVEFKAPGRRSTIRIGQYEFLRRAILNDCFAVVCDSLESFVEDYTRFQHLSDRTSQREFLLQRLPIPAKYKQSMSTELDL